MKKIFLLLISLSLFSCEGFMDTAPKDALSSATFWKTEADAKSAVVGCYDGWASGSAILYMDCGSDIAYNNFEWEGYRLMGNGGMSQSNTGSGFYTYAIIRRCNNFLAHIDEIKFADETLKKDLIAQVRVIRAYKYSLLNFWYGGVPLANKLYTTAAEAQLPRNTEAEVLKFVLDELTLAIPDLSKSPSETGRIAQGTAMAIKMRAALYAGDYTTALAAANDIKGLGKYSLEPVYSNLFNLSGKGSPEIIHATQYLENVAEFGLIGQMYNIGDGGWSSIVPTQNLVDMYEMANGMVKEEAGSGYDPVHPFAGRDPRMAMSILYPGMDWKGPEMNGVLNTLDKNVDGKPNPNCAPGADNTSKTGLTWAKYLSPSTQYSDIWNTSACPILFRYAEVLLTIAECNIEMASGNLSVAADLIDEIRFRAGMPAIDRAKYSTKEQLREILRRERAVEMAGEGLRRADILRWKDASGKMLAETVLNGDLTCITGTVDATVSDPFLRAVISPTVREKIETRIFKPYMRYLPISQDQLDKNKNLTPTPGYQ